jgi:hypothetical protein
MIGDSRSLDIHLASFSAELRHRDQDLFVRVIAAAASGGFGFAVWAHLPPVTGTSAGFGSSVGDDQSLDACVGAFAAFMRNQICGAMRRSQRAGRQVIPALRWTSTPRRSCCTKTVSADLDMKWRK